MKVFVTGGAGFLGRSIAGLLLGGNAVRIYDDLSAPGSAPGGPVRGGADFVRGDIADRGALEEACVGFDAMVHLAARTDVARSALHPEETHRINVDGTANVLECCARNGIRRVVFASSAAVYGACGGLPAREDSEARPSSPYGRSKLEAERLVREFSERFGMCGISLRVFNAYGSGCRAGVVSRFARSIAGGMPVTINGDGTQTRDFVFAGDVAAAFVLALGATGPATYNVASGRSVSINELAGMMERAVGREVARVHAERDPHDVMHSAADVSLARRGLGFEPATGLEEGLRLASVPDQVGH